MGQRLYTGGSLFGQRHFLRSQNWNARFENRYGRSFQEFQWVFELLSLRHCWMVCLWFQVHGFGFMVLGLWFILKRKHNKNKIAEQAHATCP